MLRYTGVEEIPYRQVESQAKNSATYVSDEDLEKMKPPAQRIPKRSFSRSAMPELATGGGLRFFAPAELAGLLPA